MSIICKNLGNARKHNGQILEHNRLRPTSGYDFTIKLHQHLLIERYARTVDAINVLNVFCSCYTVKPK